MNAGGSGFSVDAGSLARHAERFDGLAEEVGRIQGELRDALGEAGDCWGSDAVGQSFAAGHVEPSETTMSELGALPDLLSDVRGKLAGTAAGYRETDEGSAADFGAADSGVADFGRDTG